MLYNGEGTADFISRMSVVAAPPDRTVEDNQAKPAHYSAFLSRPAWITTGVFKVAALTETPFETHQNHEAFLSAPTWIRTGAFGLTTHRKAVSLGVAVGNGYNIFLSDSSWIRTGVFGLSKAWDEAATPAILSVFEGTWITTGVFEVAAMAKGRAFTRLSGRYDAFLSTSTWLKTGLFSLTGHKKISTPMATFGRYDRFLSGSSWIRTGVFGLSKAWDEAATPAILSVFEGTWITTGVFDPVTLPRHLGQLLRLAA
ncbi:MAG TPA: hypothetical protein DCR97_07040 [Deltaproteobacteria bacterium]|nr:hypothetical protein [Deltaproteobacteria bacterium]